MRMKSQGILLQEIPYLEKKRILKIFTQDAGLVSLMARTPSFSPFCIAEWVYQKRQSEIFSLSESSLTDSLIDLRQSYKNLAAAGSMAHDLLRSQLPAKPAPSLYELLCCYLKKIPTFETPAVLAASFRLKILLYEGLLALQTVCSRCGRASSALLLGESVCSAHADYPSILFTIPEWQTVCSLALAQKFSLLREIDCPDALMEKIASLFEERLKH